MIGLQQYLTAGGGKCPDQLWTGETTSIQCQLPKGHGHGHSAVVTWHDGEEWFYDDEGDWT